MRYLFTILALVVTLSVGAQAPFTLFKSRVDTGVINKTAAASIYRGTIGGLYKALADSISGRTDTVTKIATRAGMAAKMGYSDSAVMLLPYARKILYYTRTQTDSALNAAVDSLNSALLAANALGQYWLEKRLVDTAYTVTDSVIVVINGDRRAYKMNVSGGGGGTTYSAGNNLVLTGTVFSADTSTGTKKLSTQGYVARSLAAIPTPNLQSVTDAGNSYTSPTGLQYVSDDGVAFKSTNSFDFGQLVITNANFFPELWLTSHGTVGGNPWDTHLEVNQIGTQQFRLQRAVAGSQPVTLTTTPFAVGTTGYTLQVPNKTDGAVETIACVSDLTNKQNKLTLTTAGTGAATLVHDTLNVPTPSGGVTSVDGQTGSVSLLNNYIQNQSSSAQAARIRITDPGFGSYPALTLSSADYGTSQYWLSPSASVAMVAYQNGGTTLWSTQNFQVGYLNGAFGLYTPTYAQMTAAPYNLYLLNTGTAKTNADLAVTDNTKGVILKSPNGTCYRTSVDNAGVLSTASVTCP